MRINPDKYLSKKQQQVASALGMLCLGMIIIAGTNSYIPQVFTAHEQVAAPVETTAETTTPQAETETSPNATEELSEDSMDLNSPVRLNLAFVDSAGATTMDTSDSIAGQVFKTLSDKDSTWIASIYGLMNSTPQNMAAQLGRGRGSVIGRFDSTDETHQLDNPDSWVINSWSKTNITFYDGDGNAISGYSNAKEILSMASVYAYWNDIQDADTFRQYAEQLWSVSHDYSVRMSDVYYCEGCMDEKIEGKTGSGSADTMIAELSSEAAELPAPTQAPVETAVMEPAAETVSLASPSIAGYSIEDVPDGWESIIGPQRDIWAAVIASNSQPAAATETMVETTAVAVEKILCPGHVDLNISARIGGLDEGKGLYTKDSIGIKQENLNDTWKGWDEYNKLYAKCIRQQDWYAQYGLSVTSSLYIRNPLSSSEIAAYVDMLPDGTSEKRRAVIEQALQSVGCIPYYWGGKPYQAGFKGNNFGSITVPDDNGRTLRGLDCSGWVNWVYWTALGSRLPAESTSGLSNCGTGIQRNELQPGDIIVLTGDDAHVFMFMAWAGDDHMYLIHETGGVINNVTVSRYNIHWPYYRSLINE